MLPDVSSLEDCCSAGAASPPPAAPTVTLPTIEGCISQWYVSVPDPKKVTMKVSPGFNTPESNDPSSAVTVCGSWPWLTHTIDVPGSTAASAGSKKKSWIDTDTTFWTGTACTPWSCCAPAVGTSSSSATAESTPKYDNRRLTGFLLFPEAGYERNLIRGSGKGASFKRWIFPAL